MKRTVLFTSPRTEQRTCFNHLTGLPSRKECKKDINYCVLALFSDLVEPHCTLRLLLECLVAARSALQCFLSVSHVTVVVLV